MSKMLEDIDEAIEALPSGVSTYRVNRWAALMLKAQFCLYEGTYRKYRGLEYPEGLKSEDYIRLAAEAAEDRDPRLAAIIRMPDHVRTTDKYTMVGPDISVTSSGFQYDKYVMDGSLYPTAERVDMSFNDIPVYRFAEAHLIYAEAKAELNEFKQAEADKSINKIREIWLQDSCREESFQSCSLTGDPQGKNNRAGS